MSAAAYGSRIGAAPRWRALRLVRDDSGGGGGFTAQTAGAISSVMDLHSRGASHPRFPISSSLASVQRAQGMPGEGLTHGPPAKKNAGGRYHRSSRQPAFPARWSSRLYAISPVRRLVGHRRPHDARASKRTWHQLRDASTTRLHARKRSFVGALARRPCDLSRPSPPASRVVTIARNAPSA